MNPNEKNRHDKYHGPAFNDAHCSFCKKENPYYPNDKKQMEMRKLALERGVI